ncbi:MAG: EAL domain-containing protein [Rubrobacter sp.]|nr:EAL domain-containing protein [Rubrobacter sp.]
MHWISITAEGTETEEQLSHLRSLGCDLAQGYYFARPSSPDEIEGRARQVLGRAALWRGQRIRRST